ncbi:actin-like ATPase domain-containing protein [Amylocystis lapponica]|nr:actin-like ATPase domain-containing protein [Amylocystis lapponica]
MPRGIPNAKRDESAMRFTSFHVPLQSNTKHLAGAGTYLKAETQTLYWRNSNAAAKNKAVAEDPAAAARSEVRRGSKVLVIHPGSRFLRIGRASDVTPVTVPSVVARKHARPVASPPYVEGISRPRKENARTHAPAPLPPGDEYAVSFASDDPFDQKVAAIMVSLRDRMRFYKLRVTPNAAGIASTFNAQFQPEVIPEANDPFRVEWMLDTPDEPFLALRLADPVAQGYALILSDVEAILRATLKERFDIDKSAYKEYSIVLVIPDFYDRFYVSAIVRMLLVTMGFKQLCAQQESLAATYGAGISNACVVNMGAVTTTIACVDDGVVLSDTRLSLNMGGDDITEFLYVLLEKISFPYRDADLACWYDWNVMEDLKSRLCTLSESDVALNLYDFVVRRPGKPAEKYGLRAYDEIILAPMVRLPLRALLMLKMLRLGMRSISHPDVAEEMVEQTADHFLTPAQTQAMVISTQHLLPVVLPPPVPSEQRSLSASGGPQTPQAAFNVTPQPTPAQEDAPMPPTDGPSTRDVVAASTDTYNFPTTASGTGTTTPAVTGADPVPAPASAAPIEGSAEMPMIITDDDVVESVPRALRAQTFAGGYTIDVCFEASKLPLDVAIFNSARAAGGDEKIRKYLQAVLVIGGTALMPGMAHALESRLQAIATPLVPGMEKVQLIPPPKDVDPRVLAWKGAAVLGKMDGVADLWITAADWDTFGMRALKERCFFL